MLERQLERAQLLEKCQQMVWAYFQESELLELSAEVRVDLSVKEWFVDSDHQIGPVLFG